MKFDSNSKIRIRKPKITTQEKKPKLSKSQEKTSDLGGEDDGAAGLLNLLLGDLGDELGLDDDRLILRQDSFAQNLEVSELSDIDERDVVLGGLVLDLLRNHGPELVDVDDRAVEFVTELVEIPHTDLAEVARVILVEEDSVVVHTTGVTATTGVLPVLADSSMAGAHVPALLPVLLESGRHLRLLSLSAV
ncbi:hypothetical protein L484_027707 [Morus notabilis]|uniref:Uncharacterized protein n=1 Tax=Morus notabilis TaxID=981085 RepID=W9RN37_9ROSA|nr:hypothetical protein L484_027707 [Morus notabilis]